MDIIRSKVWTRCEDITSSWVFLNKLLAAIRQSKYPAPSALTFNTKALARLCFNPFPMEICLVAEKRRVLKLWWYFELACIEQVRHPGTGLRGCHAYCERQRSHFGNELKIFYLSRYSFYRRHSCTRNIYLRRYDQPMRYAERYFGECEGNPAQIGEIDRIT